MFVITLKKDEKDFERLGFFFSAEFVGYEK